MHNLWLMGKAELAELRKTVDSVRAGLFTDSIGSSRATTFEKDGVNVLRIHGPIFARGDFFTEMMGLKSVEDYMEVFEELLTKTEPILLDVDSPGGQVGLLFEFADQIFSAGSRVTSYTSGTAASAGFLLHQAAQGGRLVSEGSVLGSAGVVASFTKDSDNTVTVLSKNAGNKRGKQGLQSIVNQIEDQFHDSLSKYTGLTRAEIVDGGEQGGEVTGTNALAVGFATAVSNFKGALALSTGGEPSAATQPEEGNEMTDFTKAELDAAVKSASETATKEANAASKTERDKAIAEAIEANNERYAKLSAHPNGSNVKAVARLAKSSMSIEEALEMMEDVAPAPGNDNGNGSDSKATAEAIDKAASDAIAAIRAAASDTKGLSTEGRKSDEGDGGESEDPATLEANRIKAANERRNKGAKG